VDSRVGACPFRKTGIHFSGTCARCTGRHFVAHFSPRRHPPGAVFDHPRTSGAVCRWQAASVLSVIFPSPSLRACAPTLMLDVDREENRQDRKSLTSLTSSTCPTLRRCEAVTNVHVGGSNRHRAADLSPDRREDLAQIRPRPSPTPILFLRYCDLAMVITFPPFTALQHHGSYWG
jgi:hypothetical protein